jgi:hypothetical protein
MIKTPSTIEFWYQDISQNNFSFLKPTMDEFVPPTIMVQCSLHLTVLSAGFRQQQTISSQLTAMRSIPIDLLRATTSCIRIRPIPSLSIAYIHLPSLEVEIWKIEKNDA